jgi:hypothetical protein
VAEDPKVREAHPRQVRVIGRLVALPSAAVKLVAYRSPSLSLSLDKCVGENPKPELAGALSSQTADIGVLADFVASSQPWNRERLPVPRRLRWALWALVPVELFWAIWLATIVTGATACRGPICTVTTLDHHAAALLACGVFSVAVLAGLIPTTRGFSRCNGPEVIGLAIATAASGASLLGIAALMTGALILLIILATFVLASTATSRRETDHARTRPPYPIALAEVASRSRTR